MYTISTPWGTEDITLSRSSYRNNGTLAVQAWCEEGPYATLTVNIEDSNHLASESAAFIDTNNCPWAPGFLSENGIAEPTGIVGYSGFCAYPLYEFDTNKIEEG